MTIDRRAHGGPGPTALTRALRRARTPLLASIVVAVAMLGTACTGPARPAAGPTSAAPVAPAVRHGIRIPASWQPHAVVAPPTHGAVPYARLGTAAAFATAVNRADGTQVALSPGVYSFRDFHAAAGTIDGAVLGPTVAGLRGAGAARTVLEMTPHTSTHAGDIPSGFPNTNQLSLVRVTAPGTVLSGFTLQATPQGHLYNGLRIDQVHGLRVADLRVAGIPGDDNAPPGETFGINDYRTVGSRYTRVEVDGRGVGGAGFGANGSDDLTITDSWFHDQGSSMGATFWQARDVTVTDTASTDNRGAGFNFERVSGTVRLSGIVTAGNSWSDLSIASDVGSARFTIADPVYAGSRLTILLPKSYQGRPNLQRAGDIRVLVHGVDRTADVVRFVSRRLSSG